jgi:hypothetical protein
MLEGLLILWVAEAVKAFVDSQPYLSKCLTHSAINRSNVHKLQALDAFRCKLLSKKNLPGR